MSLYEKLRKRYSSKSGMYLNKKTCADLEEFINQRVIEELKDLQVGLPAGTDGMLMYIRLNKRIKELKQE